MALTRPKFRQFDTTIANVSDPLTVLHNGSAEANVDVGFIINRAGGYISNVALYWNEATGSFVTSYTNSSGGTDTNVSVVSYAPIRTGDATVEGLFITEGIFWSANGNSVTTGGALTTSTTPPAVAVPGDKWYNTDEDIVYEYVNDGTSSFWVDIYSPAFVVTPSGDLTLTGNLLPAANVTYDLGSASARWKDLYLSGSTINLNGATISSVNNAVTISTPSGSSFELADGNAGAFGNLSVTGGVASTSKTTGALKVTGGAGISGNAYVNAIYTDSYNYANGNPFISTTLANTVEITANATGGINVGFSLVASGVTAGNYGSASSIPTIVVDTKGRITGITTNAVSTTISLSGTSGSGSVAGGGTLTFAGSYGVTATASSSTITVGTPQDLRTTASPTFAGATLSGATQINGPLTLSNAIGSSGVVTISNSTPSTNSTSGALVVTGGAGIGGDMYVAGNIYAAFLNTVNSSQLEVSAPLVYLETTSVYPYNYDIGMYSHFIGGPANTYVHTGAVRSYENGYWGFFSNVKPEPAGSISWTNAGIIWDKVKAGEVILANTTSSTSTTSGALQVAGGAGIAGDLYIGGTTYVGESTISPSTINTGTLAAGTGNVVYLNVGNDATVGGATTLSTVTAGGLQAKAIGNVTPGTGAFTTLTNSGVHTSSGNIVAQSGTASTSTTTGALVVNGGTGITGNVYIGGSIYGGITASGNGDSNQPFKLASDYNSWATIFGPSWTAADGWGIFWAGNQNAAFGTNGNGASNSGPGNIWGNSTNPNELVMVGGGATQWTCYLSDGRTWQRGALYCASDVYSSYSDIRLKTIVGYIENPIALLREIEVFYYEPNEEAIKRGATPGRKVGVSAQSVLKSQPEAVGQSGIGDEYLTVQYERLVPLLVETCKKQQDQIDQLQQQVAELQRNKGNI